jgi:hypothetical protein
VWHNIYYLYSFVCCVLFERGVLFCVMCVSMCCVLMKYHWHRVEAHLQLKN